MKLLKNLGAVARMALSAALASAQHKPAELKVRITPCTSGVASVFGLPAKAGADCRYECPRRVSPGFWTTLMKLGGKKNQMVHLPLRRTLPELGKSQLIRSLSASSVSR